MSNTHPSPDRLAWYGISWPGWFVKWRGLYWLRSGYCPCCYSSPPWTGCPICDGDRAYGNNDPESRYSPGASRDKRARWRNAWLARCTEFGV